MDPKIESRCQICDGMLVEGTLSEHQRCAVCGHHFNRAPGTVGAVTNQVIRFRPATRPTRLQVAQIRAVAARNPEPTCVVDVGCGDGSFLHALERSGTTSVISTLGIEVDSTSVEQARSVHGVEVVEAIDLVTGPIGIATAWHSLEHMPIPHLRHLLSGLAERLTRDGGILVSVPNGASFQQRVFRSRWAFHDAPHHHSVFTPTSLDRLMAGCGLVRDRSVRIPAYGLFSAVQSAYNLFIQPHNTLYYALKRGTLHLNRRTLLKHVLVTPLAAAIALPFLSAEVFAARAASLNVWYRRPPSADAPDEVHEHALRHKDSERSSL